MQQSVATDNSRRKKLTNFFKVHFSWKFFRSVLSPREIIFPLTLQKPFLWIFYSIILGGLIATQATVGFVEYLYTAVNANIIALAVFLIAVEPVYFLFMMLFTKYPKVNLRYANIEEEAATAITDLEAPEPAEVLDQDTAVIIACHKSQDNIRNTLNHWLKIVPANRIYVVDNGDPPYPNGDNGELIDNTRRLIAEINPAVNYVFSERGNKTYALFLGALQATNSTNVIICDDDIVPPLNILDALPLLDDEHKAVVFPLKTMQRGEHGGLLTDWQNLEYCLADHAKNYEDRSCGPTRPHGACSLWNKEFMVNILFKHHDTRFMGEDLKMGLRALYENTKLKYAHGLYVKTYVPSSFFGPMPNYYTQRVRVWEMGRHIYWPMVTRYLITTWQKSRNPLKFIRDNTVLKIEQLYFLYQVLADWLRLPVLLLSANNWRYWAVSSGCYGLLVVSVLLWNYVKLRNHPEERHKLSPILTYPIYKIIYKSFSVLALFRAIFIFIPNYSSLIRIDQLEAARADREARRRAFIAEQSALAASRRPFNWAEYVLNMLMTESQREQGIQPPAQQLSTIYSAPPPQLGSGPLIVTPAPLLQQPQVIIPHYFPGLVLPPLMPPPGTQPSLPVADLPESASPPDWARSVTRLLYTEAQRAAAQPQPQGMLQSILYSPYAVNSPSARGPQRGIVPDAQLGCSSYDIRTLPHYIIEHAEDPNPNPWTYCP